MGPEYLPSDIDSLYITAGLVDTFWLSGATDSKLAGEIRQEMARFGATPLDRRRLEWELERKDDEPAKPDGPPKPVVDPRSTMRLVG
jgi:hypothetical protein